MDECMEDYAWLFVLIESDWNLKPDMKAALKDFQDGINRIRLEFKGDF